MVYLARQAGEDGPARKQDIADAEEISADYVEQILIRLRAGGLVLSHRGARGGFSLAREAHMISVLDVLEAAEGPLSLVPEEDLTSGHPTVAVSCRLWRATQESLQKQFRAVTIAVLAEEVSQMRHGEQIMYDI